MTHTDTTQKTSVGAMKPAEQQWPGTPAEWDAERDRRANAILSQYGPMVSGFSDTQFDLDDALTALDQSADLNRNTTLHATRRA